MSPRRRYHRERDVKLTRPQRQILAEVEASILFERFRENILALMPWVSERLILEMYEQALKEPSRP